MLAEKANCRRGRRAGKVALVHHVSANSAVADHDFSDPGPGERAEIVFGEIQNPLRILAARIGPLWVEVQRNLVAFAIEFTDLAPHRVNGSVGPELLHLLELRGFHEIDESGVVLPEQLVKPPRGLVHEFV